MLENLIYRQDKDVLITPSIAITLFTKSSFFDLREEIINFYAQCFKLIGDKLSWFRTETMREFEPITTRTLKMVPFWFEPHARRRGFYVMILKGGKSPRDISPEGITLAFLNNSGGHLCLTLPCSYIQKSAEPLLILTKNLVQKIPFGTGTAGYALIADTVNANAEVTKRLISLTRRYSGFDIPDRLGSVHYEKDGIKCINWLTLLDNNYYQVLRKKAIELTNQNDRVVIHNLEQGVIIQAGNKPEFGDINKGELLKSYHDVGKIVKSIRIKEYRVLFETEDETLEWLSRFDQ
ncbi:MAG: DUF3396 domain-containing protein [Desulfobacterales bacterium]|nr:DUF3396 domain-containing protein [Desulfobacterales bacterium]